MKAKWFALAVPCALSLLASSCRLHDWRTVRILVPEMKNEACAGIIRDALTRGCPIRRDDILADFEDRTLTVRYDSLVLARKNIEFAIADAGFRTLEIVATESGIYTNEIPANPEAAKSLPPECSAKN